MSPLLALLSATLLSQLIQSPERLMAIIEGRVADLDGNPISGAVLSFLNEPSIELRTDREGRFEAHDIKPGMTVLGIKSRGFRERTLIISLEPADRVRLDIGLLVGKLADHPSTRLEGTVSMPNGHPVPGAKVNIRASLNASLNVQSQAGPDGRYVAHISEAGQYDITFAAPDGKSAVVHARFWPLPRTRTLDITLRDE